jgi:hypothetical protein
MAGGRRVYVPKKVGETCNMPFDFVADLGTAETLISSSVTASVYTGVDASPSAVLQGSSSISGTQVNQLCTAGVVGTLYKILAQATTSLGQVLEISMYLAVMPDLP